ncbi:hypothetical protein SAMN05443544_0250 [Agromyces cerinus subsp. cerinus]|uniref:4-amino-4-deoxy-L-arabinose transferase n=1 Tax=Agromyces cerinus subsp. cerinus TaxID=232089 RepID=A0A1N6DHU9_9MICO|nr:hypothetical protein SAMN05443544_0250 [Agromyces cerinus subsp. cerinus]
MAVVVAVLVLTALAVSLGAPFWLAIVVCTAAWVFALAPNSGLPVAAAAGALASLGAVLAALVVSWLLPVVPALVTLVIAQALAGALPLLSRRTPRAGFAWKRELSGMAVAATGAFVWLAVLLVANLTGGSGMSWALAGDAANVTLFARALIDANGVALSVGSDPVPLTAALVSSFILPGRTLAAPTAAGDISGLVQMWSFTIAACAVASGLLVRQLQRADTPLGRVGAALVSLLPLSWFALAPSVERGFINVHLILLLLLCCAILVLGSGRNPVLSAIGLALGATLVLATWSPLVLIPGLMLLLVLVRERRILLGSGRLRVVAVCGSLAVMLGFAIVLPLRSLLSFGSVLADASGGSFTFEHWLFIAIAVCWSAAAVAHGVLAGWRAVWSLAPVPIGGAIGLAALMWLRRDAETFWGYYTLKILWLVAVILLITAIALALTASVRLLPFLLVASGAVAVTVLSRAAWVPGADVYSEQADSPLVRIATGTYSGAGGDELAQHIMKYADADPLVLPWKTGHPDEARTIFWAIQLASPGATDYDLRIFAYQRDLDSVDDLCRIRELMHPPVTVVTADEAIRDAAVATCPDAGEVVLEGPGGSGAGR